MGLIRLHLDGNEEQKETTIVLRLSLARLWAMVAGIGTLVASAFALGVFYQSYATQLQVEQKNIELAREKVKVEDLQKICPVKRAKADFVVLDTRRSLKKKEAARFPSNKKLKKEVKDTEKQIAIFLEENVNKKFDESGTAIISVVLDNKDSIHSKIQFRGEPETYEIPQDVKKLTKNITWNNAPQGNASSIFTAVLRQESDSAELLDDSSNRKMCPLKKKSALLTQRTRTLEIGEYYPAIILPQP